MGDKVISQEELEYLQSVVTALVHLTMLIPIDKLEMLIGMIDRQEIVLSLMNPEQFLAFSERIARGGDVARAVLNFRRELDNIKQRETKAYSSPSETRPGREK